MDTKFARIKRAACRLLLLVLASVFALALCELGLRLLIPPSKDYRVLLANRRKVFHPDTSVLHGIEGPARYTVNSEGIRGREWGSEPGEYRILAIGGSTTESLYQDDEETWPALLEGLLGQSADGRAVWVGNVGRSGHGSRDHVVQVKYLAAQHPGLDAFLILVGINDVSLALMHGDNYVSPPPITDPEAEALQIQRAFSVVPGKLHEPGTKRLLAPEAPWYNRTALYQLSYRAMYKLRDWYVGRGLAQDVQGKFIARLRAQRQRAARIRHELPDLTGALVEYTRNLHAIVDQAEMRAIRLVFLTQPALWRADLSAEEKKLLWLGGVGDFIAQHSSEYYTVAALAEAMGRYNRALLDVCRERGVECFDLAARVPRDSSIFYDGAHFTEKGARLVAEEVAGYFRQTEPLRRD